MSNALYRLTGGEGLPPTRRVIGAALTSATLGQSNAGRMVQARRNPLKEPAMRLKPDERHADRSRSRVTKRLEGRVHLPPAARRRTRKGTVADTRLANDGQPDTFYSGPVGRVVPAATAQNTGRAKPNPRVITHHNITLALLHSRGL